MGANDKADAAYHGRTVWTCEWCSAAWSSPLIASRCCDELSMSVDEEKHRVYRAYD